MPFLPIEGVMVYNHREPLSNEARRFASYMRATHDGLRHLTIILFKTLYYGGWIVLVVDMFTNPSLPSQTWQFMVGGVAIASFAVFRRLIVRDKAIEKSHQALFKGEHRMYYTVPLDYSYQVLFTPTMLSAMQDPTTGAFVSGRVDALLCNGASESWDKCIHDETQSVVMIGCRFEARIHLVNMVESLSDGLGIVQSEHFTRLRTAAQWKLRQELARALEQHKADAAALEELRQLR